MKKTTHRIRYLALSAAGALGILLGTPAMAADYNDEQIEVTAPRHHATTSIPGAEIRTVAASRQVRFDDLNLNSRYGARTLHNRIRATARTLCRELEFMHPVVIDNASDCYRDAVQDAMYQADAAIADSRGYAQNE